MSDKSKGDFATNSEYKIDAHLGTHIDAPLHHIPGGKTTEEIELTKLYGPCSIIDFSNLKIISARDLDEKLDKNPHLKQLRYLFKTANSSLLEYESQFFHKDYVALDKSAAKWLVDNGAVLAGIDYYSIQLFDDPPDVHEILLANEIVILETINLFRVHEGVYNLLCLPIKISGLEGIHCRAVLQEI